MLGQISTWREAVTEQIGPIQQNFSIFLLIHELTTKKNEVFELTIDKK